MRVSRVLRVAVKRKCVSLVPRAISVLFIRSKFTKPFTMNLLASPLPTMTFTENTCKPTAMSRAGEWSAEVENLSRFQQAGYRDELEYTRVKQGTSVHTMMV